MPYLHIQRSSFRGGVVKLCFALALLLTGVSASYGQCIPAPSLYETTPGNVCGQPRQVRLTAELNSTTRPAYGYKLYWYKGNATTPFFISQDRYYDEMSVQYHEEYVSATTTFKVSVYDNYQRCESPAASVTVNVQVALVPPFGEIYVCSNEVFLQLNGAPQGATYRIYEEAKSNPGYYQQVGSTTTPYYTIPADRLAYKNYYVDAITAAGCQTSKSLFSERANTAPPLVTGPTSRCGPGPVTLQATTSWNWNEMRWYSAGGSLLHSGAAYSPTLSQTTTFYVRAVLAGGRCLTEPTAYTVTVNPLPQVDAGSDQVVYANQRPVALKGTPAGGSWSGPGIENGRFMPGQLAAGNYSLTYSYTDAKGCSNTDAVVFMLQSNHNNYNHIVNSVLITDRHNGGPVQESDIRNWQRPGTLTAEELNQAITYFDGLGRPVQKIEWQGSPTKKDVVLPYEYDQLGREPKKYLPYTGEDNGRFKTDALTPATGKLFEFYKAAGSDVRALTDVPFGPSRFEASPLGRVLEQGAPGGPWQIGGPGTDPLDNRTIKTSLRTNVAGDNVRRLQYNFPTEAADAKKYGTVALDGFYAAGQLLVSEARDEQRNVTLEYKNKVGQVVLKKVQTKGSNRVSSFDLPDSDFLFTYYVHDDIGNLRMVIQPEGAELLTSNSSIDEDFIGKWCFTYHYDDRGRLVEKRVPGAGIVYMVYGKRDEVLLTQDAKQRENNQWLFTKYDALGRVTMSGMYRPAARQGRVSLQKEADAYPSAKNHEERSRDVLSNNVYTAREGYTFTQTFPAVNTDRDELLTVNFYDDYNFDFSLDGSADHTYPGAFAFLTGRPTGSRVRVLPSSNSTQAPNSTPWLLTVTFYDKVGRIIHAEADNHLTNGKDKTTNTYRDLSGKVFHKKTEHKGNATVTVDEAFSYDHGGRALTHHHQINAGDNVLLAQLKYNELGQVVEKALHGVKEDVPPGVITLNEVIGSGLTRVEKATQEINLVEGFWAQHEANFTAQIIPLGDIPTTFLQTVNFQYNVRGWLTHINDAALNDAKDLFGLELLYTEGKDLADLPIAEELKQYNGNIAAQKWKTRTDASPVARMYTYQYDQLNRIKAADYFGKGKTSAGVDLDEAGYFSLGEVTYFSNGNIKTLKQNGLNAYLEDKPNNQYRPQFGPIDNLVYEYEGNRLKKVEDDVASAGVAGDFQNGATLSQEYTYDEVLLFDENGNPLYDSEGTRLKGYGNGNLVADANKKITSILYNHLNLPQKVVFGDNYIEYTYGADGATLYKEVYEGGSLTARTDYAKGFVYVNSYLQFFPTAEGRVIHPHFVQDGSNGNGFAYEYHYKDHLGNLRLAFRQPKPKVIYQATMEVDKAYRENIQFVNVSQTRDLLAPAHGLSSASARLNKATAERKATVLGPWKTLKVRAKDEISAKVFAHYNDESNGIGVSLTTYLAAPDYPVSGGSESGKNKPLLQFGISIAPVVPAPAAKEPKAYLQAIIYNEEYKVVDKQIRMVTTDAKGTGKWQALSIAPFSVVQDGYVQILVANESDVDVWFDDLEIAYTEGMVVQENHYSPWGMNLVGIEKQGSPDHKFQYNGIEKEDYLGLNWDMAFQRSYDPQLGRWHQVDPKAEFQLSFSPYTGMHNNPVRFSDPNGDIAPAVWAAIAYAIETGGETGVDMALGITFSYLTGIPYTGWDIAADYATNLIPGWGEARTANKIADIGVAIGNISRRLSHIPGASGIINDAGAAFGKLKNADGFDAFKQFVNEAKGALFEFQLLNKYGTDLIGASIKRDQLYDNNLLGLSSTVLGNLKRSLGDNFEFDFVRKLDGGVLEFIEASSKNEFKKGGTWDQLKQSGQRYLNGKFDKFKKVKDAGVNAEFSIVLDGADDTLRESIQRYAQDNFGLSVKILSE